MEDRGILIKINNYFEQEIYKCEHDEKITEDTEILNRLNCIKCTLKYAQKGVKKVLGE